MLFGDGKGVCPNCGQASGFTTVENRGRVWPERYVPNGVHGRSPRRVSDYATIVILQCLFCDDTVVLLDLHHKPDPEKSRDYVASRRIIVPEVKPRSLDAAAPETVRSLYEEASVCENAGAMRGAGVLYRAAVEELVKAQGATGRTLYDKITSLSTQLADDLIADLHEARMLGNDSIHDGLTYSAEEVADIAGLIEEAVLVLYVQPAEKQRMRDQRRSRRSATAQG